MKRIKVLHLITRLIVGGAQENTIYTALLLDSSEYMVDVISGPQTGSEGSLIEEFEEQGGKLIIIPQLVREISPLNDFLALWKLYRMMKRNRYDIVHTHSSKAGILGRFAAKMAGVPVIVHTIHGWSFHDHMPKLLKMLFVELERMTASLSDALIVVTKLDISKGIHEGIGKREQYHLIRSAIFLDKFDPSGYDRRKIRAELGIPEDVLVVGNVGRFSPQKNPLTWVRVADAIVKIIPNIRFLLVGDGPLKKQVFQMIETLELKNKFIMTGIRRDVPRMLRVMDVFLLTSLWEGLPRVIPQAMAMELPIVANVADGTQEVINHGETGFLCQPNRISELASYCVRLLENPQERIRMGEKGRQYVMNEFDLKKMIEEIEDLYNKNLVKKGIRR